MRLLLISQMMYVMDSPIASLKKHLMKRLVFLGLILFNIIIQSCSLPKLTIGTYRSNFAISGSFVEQITIKEDSSFEYQSRGHLINRMEKGHFTLNHDRLVLNYDFLPIDTSGNAQLSNVLGFSIDEDMKSWKASFPKLFFIRNGKLLASDDSGKVKRKARNKSFLKNPKKKYYLKQIT